MGDVQGQDCIGGALFFHLLTALKAT